MLALNVDYRPTAEFRVVQLTPPGSACSVHLALADSPTRVHGLCLVTNDLAAETWAGGWEAGLDPQRRDYASFADFTDPDGNTWTLQERGYRA